jgi:heme-degrading monooxygenase HmoA
MSALLVRLKVADYSAWKPVFDDQSDARRANGSLGGRVFRNDDDPNEILALLDWDDLERARLFAKSDEMRHALVQSGVVDQPDVWFLDETERSSV